ncbi:MAG: CCA tRNA nucleotidyltransferase [Hyphomicrobiaceae bacterium]|nr:CCA tRNA nucleotidyltransferase [Hyphomicrobiaceae bacterium]
MKPFRRRLKKTALKALIREDKTQALLAALAGTGEETRIIGGAVRNALLGAPVEDIDLATTLLPQQVMEKAAAAGFRPVPTGIEHGTVTVVVSGKPFEVTTLRRDVETDGRRAVVAFSRDFDEDAGRRDFTFNALSLDGEGRLHDPFEGLADLAEGRVRFIGDPRARIMEDYLRILRFFRFYARYGHGQPDREALLAIVALRDGLGQLSVERVWMELKKLLATQDPSRALRWMRQGGVYPLVLPESGDMDNLDSVMAMESALGIDADPLRRLEALLQPRIDRVQALVQRLKLSAREASRLRGYVSALGYDPVSRAQDLFVMVHRLPPDALTDAIVHMAARVERLSGDGEATGRSLILRTQALEGASFPVRAADLMALGHKPGPALGQMLKTLEDLWVESGFALSQAELLESLPE